MNLLLSIFQLSFLLITLTKAQNICQWYNWTTSDWPTNTTTQNFEQIIGAAYLGNSDFESGGEFYGQIWTSVFFTDPEYYRPLGFKYAVLGEYNDPTVCLHADGTASYIVELMVYSFHSVKLCAIDMGADNYNTQQTSILTACATQYLYQCITADSSQSSLKVAIYCTTGCENLQSQQLLFRFRRSDISYSASRSYASNNPEMWCTHIASSIEWPDELNDAVPSQYTASNSNLNSANVMHISVISMVVISLSILALL